MGCSQSSPEEEIIKDINLEIQNIVNNLDKCKTSIETTIFNKQQQHIEELKTKLTAFYKSIETNNEFIKTLSSTSADTQTTIKTYLNKLYEIEKVKERESKVKEHIQIKWLACKFKCEKHEEALFKLKQDHVNERKTNEELREVVINHSKTINNLQEEKKLEKKANQAAAVKLRTVGEQLEDTKKELEKTETEKRRVILDCKKEVQIKTEQLNELKNNVNKLEQQRTNVFRKENEYVRVLETRLTECQRKLDIEKTAKKEEFDKLRAEYEKQATKYKIEVNAFKNQLAKIKSTPEQSGKSDNHPNKHCCDDLKKKLDGKQAELKREQENYERKINRLINQTNTLRGDLRRSRNGLKREENLKKEIEKNSEGLQIKLTTCQKELEREKCDKQEEINKYEIIKLHCDYLEKELKTNIIEREAEASKHQAQINTVNSNLVQSQKDCRHQAALREGLEKQVALLKEQMSDIKMLEEKLNNCHKSLEIEKNTKQEESRTVQLLKEESEFRKAEIEKEILKHKQETSRLVNQLNRIRKDLNKFKNNCKQQELLRKTAESKATLLEQQTATLNSLAETLKEYYYQESFDHDAKSNQNKSEKLKAVTQNKTVSSARSVIDRKNTNEEYTSLEQLRENNKLIRLLKEHLNILQGSLPKIQENNPSGNVAESCDQNVTTDPAVAATSSATDRSVPILVTTAPEHATTARFCSNQQKELDELHEELQSLLK